MAGIADWLARYSGISTGIIGSHSLARAVRQRMRATGLGDPEAYEALLLESAEEQQNLVELVVVPETWFFRDRHPYRQLREHVGARLQAGLPGQPLRLLSAPCATGEEPYSMAMTLLELGLSTQAFRIDAIDICRRSIQRAREAVYGRHSFRGVSEAEQQRHFQRTQRGLVPHPVIREPVQFQCSNLMTCLSELSGGYEVIFCRNLLIYLEPEAIQQLLRALAELLRPGGLLIVGSAETVMVPADLFTPIRQAGVFGFLRREPASEPVVEIRRAAGPAGSRSGPASPLGPGAGREPSPRGRLLERSRRPVAARNGPGLKEPRAAEPKRAPSTRGPDGSTDAELQRCRLEVERHPGSDQAQLRLAHCLLTHNQPQEACDCLRRCLYLKPDCREAMELLIELSESLGDLERSRQLRGRLERLTR